MVQMMGIIRNNNGLLSTVFPGSSREMEQAHILMSHWQRIFPHDRLEIAAIVRTNKGWDYAK